MADKMDQKFESLNGKFDILQLDFYKKKTSTRARDE